MQAPKRLPAVSDWLQQLRILSTTKHDDLVRWWTPRSLLEWLTNVNASRVFFGHFGKTYHSDHNVHNHALLDLLGHENITVKKAEWVLHE